MNGPWYGATVLALLTLPACSGSKPAAPAAAPSFVNRVWAVAESKQVAPGELRVFLSEGTMVMASPHATPALGTWRRQDRGLRITEEGLEYQVDILELTNDTFRIRIHSPGEAPSRGAGDQTRRLTSTVGGSMKGSAILWVELETGAAGTAPVIQLSLVRE